MGDAEMEVETGLSPKAIVWKGESVINWERTLGIWVVRLTQKVSNIPGSESYQISEY